MKAETWRAVRGRVAQLLPSALVEALNGYYSPLETLLTLLAFKKPVEGPFERQVRGKVAERRGEEIPRSRDPYTEYATRTLAAQNEVRSRIKEYLARPW